MAAELEVEAARWAEITALVDLLTPEERLVPGYYREPDGTVKDRIVHLGYWHAEARSELLKIATRMYNVHDFEVERHNAEVLAAHKDEDWDVVWDSRGAGATLFPHAITSVVVGSPPIPMAGRDGWRGTIRTFDLLIQRTPDVFAFGKWDLSVARTRTRAIRRALRLNMPKESGER